MRIGKLLVTGVEASAEDLKQITSGMAGVQIDLEFTDDIWAGLTKTVVFKSYLSRDVLVEGDTVTVPHEVLQLPGWNLSVGVYGTDAERKLIVPTLWSSLGKIHEGANPTGDPGADPSLPVWFSWSPLSKPTSWQIPCSPILDCIPATRKQRFTTMKEHG